jgi:hypothetical protein
MLRSAAHRPLVLAALLAAACGGEMRGLVG